MGIRPFQEAFQFHLLSSPLLRPPSLLRRERKPATAQKETERMEDSKKRRLEDTGNEEPSYVESEEQLRVLLDPLRKDQLLDLLVKLHGLLVSSKISEEFPPFEECFSIMEVSLDAWLHLLSRFLQGSQYASVAEEIRSVASADPVHRKLFVRGLAWETTSETLCAAFAVHGEIEEGAVIVDKATGKSRGYGFITYRHMESTHRALKDPSKLIDGRLAVCNLACEGLSSASVTSDQAQRKLYIGGLSPDISSETLLNFFGRYGEIEEGSVAYDKETNKSRGFGFITYKTLEAAKKALDDPNKILGGRNITVKLADSQKAKVGQTQLPPAIVPIAIPVPTGYAQPAKTPLSSYSAYPQALAAYPTPYTGIASQYQPQAQVSYVQAPAKKDTVGLPAGTVGLPGGAPPAIAGYPYYGSKQ
ncbi:hypothetical protein ACLOJK_017418 [Asimina triloba]